MSARLNPLVHYPAATPPAGVTSNFVDPPLKGREIAILDGVFTGLMLLAVLVRIFVRARITKQWGWDDLTCSLAALGSLTKMIIYNKK
ncbi:hypothetical protein FJTKL_12815 [Diaporthe vaccinii]|uniref:Integral membrane protein n=1 Tax=Diaporthe vaccinii TaxID=105482 RepID=A0ABR4F9N9_9PEZI